MLCDLICRIDKKTFYLQKKGEKEKSDSQVLYS